MSIHRSKLQEELARAGASRQKISKAFELAYLPPDKKQWIRFLELSLISIGSALLLSGIIFFFAYNWAEMHHFAKLGIVAGALLLSGTAGILLKAEVPARIMQIAVFSLTGTLLALFGQIYQTGANACDLFIAWSLLTLPLALFSSSGTLHLLWLLLANVAVLLYGAQILGSINHLTLTLSAGAASAGAIALKEKFSAENKEHQAFVLIAGSLLALRLIVPSCSAILRNFEHADENGILLFTIVLLALAFISYWIFRFRLAMLALAAMCGVTIIFCLFINAFGDEGAGAFFLGSFLLILLTTLAVLGLIQINRSQSHAE